MRKIWKSAVALLCAGTLLLTGCGAGKGTSSESGTSEDEVTSLAGTEGESAEAAANDAGSSMEAYDEETAVKIGIPAAKADPDSPDKEETVHVKADAGGSVNEVKVDNVLHVYDMDEVTDVSELDDIHNTEGDEDFRQDGSDLAWQNLGSDIKYEGSSDREVPVGVTVTYWLDGQEIAPQDLAGQSGHVRIRFDYENRTSMTVTVHDKSYNVKVPFVVMTAMVLPEDTFGHIEVTNGRCMSFEGQNMVLGYAMPGLAESLRLEEFEPTEEVEIPSYVEVECDAQDFELSFTATVATNGLFKDIKDNDLDDIEALDTETIQKAADDMKKQFLALTEYTDDMDKLEGSVQSIRKMYSDLKGGIDQLAIGSGQLTEGISQFNSGIDALYSGALLLTQGTSALESYGSPLLEGASALTEGMSALHEGIKTFDEEAIQELTELAGDDLLNLSSRIRAIKICDTSYQTFSGLAPGMKGSVKFIIETEEIARD